MRVKRPDRAGSLARCEIVLSARRKVHRHDEYGSRMAK